jgi:cellulose synthase/poly-beta-1,6-N-acetylglucosamine synthase-like glycosyltransferase
VTVALASRKPPISPSAAGDGSGAATTPTTFSVLIAARDEAAVLPGLVRDIAHQDYRDTAGNPLFELLVIDDRSVDGTGDAARHAAQEGGIERVTRVIRREGREAPDGKGAALTAAQPEACSGDVVVVLDADARVGPSFLRIAAGYFAAGAQAVTARRRILGLDRGQLAGAQADEQTLDGELNRGRWGMGGCSEFRGNGIMIGRDLLASVGGWRASALTEDLDLSSRIMALAGEPVVWAVDVEVWEQPVRDWSGLWQQRLRWAEGAMRRVFEHGPAIVASPKVECRAKMDFVAYVGQLAVPAIVVGAAASTVATGRKRTLLSLLAGYLGVSAGLAWDSLRWERHADGSAVTYGERAWRGLRVGIFSAFWLPVVPAALLNIALRRGPVPYKKMDHLGDPGSEAGA